MIKLLQRIREPPYVPTSGRAQSNGHKPFHPSTSSTTSHAQCTLRKQNCHTLIMQNEYLNARRPFVLCHNKTVSTTVPSKLKARSLSPRKRLMCILTSRQGRGRSSGSAPSADTVSDTTKRLEIVPARELVFFCGRRHVSADDADGEVWDFGDGDFGAVEL